MKIALNELQQLFLGGNGFARNLPQSTLEFDGSYESTGPKPNSTPEVKGIFQVQNVGEGGLYFNVDFNEFLEKSFENTSIMDLSDPHKMGNHVDTFHRDKVHLNFAFGDDCGMGSVVAHVTPRIISVVNYKNLQGLAYIKNDDFTRANDVRAYKNALEHHEDKSTLIDIVDQEGNSVNYLLATGKQQFEVVVRSNSRFIEDVESINKQTNEQRDLLRIVDNWKNHYSQR